ncbi:sulfite exporter TauE/SafE family protein [Alteribacillus sp. HJP-4]|uniref:sulfite exporter TauE/SafE family protein n=1 Tax=Alteribacillus sp. HJP-4 TaxID=2775394 RepID=UPI0035CCE7EC
MRKLIIFSLVGFFAQLIDGSLGMAFGLTSTTLLLAFGIAPAIASASIHMAEIATTAASGMAHYKFGNVDKKLALKIMVPGAAAAFLGAAFLSSLPGALIKPFISAFLLLMGLYIICKFLFRDTGSVSKKAKAYPGWFLVILGAVGGFLDAVGGGGWGPVNTPVLLSRQGAVPRKVIGTVDTSECAVAIAATLGFVLFLGWEQYNWMVVGAFVIGGIIAAPIAAWLVRILPAYLLGVAVGGFIIVTNSYTLLQAGGAGKELILIFYIVLLSAWGVAILTTLRKHQTSAA